MEQTITLLLENNGLPTSYVVRFELKRNFVYYLDIPRVNLKEWRHVRVKVTVKDKE